MRCFTASLGRALIRSIVPRIPVGARAWMTGSITLVNLRSLAAFVAHGEVAPVGLEGSDTKSSDLDVVCRKGDPGWRAKRAAEGVPAGVGARARN